MNTPDIFTDDEDSEASPTEKYYGKYRGIVVNNVDPELRGRILAIVPDVSTVFPTTWAMPCLPVAGPGMGMFTLPMIGAGVWIEFEQGDPDYPIWVGCFYGTTLEVPLLAKTIPPGVPGLAFQTLLQNGIVISDVPGPTGGILIKTATGAFISVSDVGITISNGKGAVITMTGPAVDINAGALTIV